MSFEDDLKDVGDSIGKLVDNAVNSQDFQELNRKISDTINQFVYPNRKGPFRANGTQEPSRGYSADTSYSSQHSSHNNTAQQTGPHHYSYGPGGTMPGKSAGEKVEKNRKNLKISVDIWRVKCYTNEVGW